MALTLNHEAVSHARSLIAAGKIDHGPWNGASATRDAQTCLGHDDSKAGTDEEWKYPIVSGGHVNVKGVGSAAGYAETEGASAIASVAHRLASEIHGKSHASIAASGDSDQYILHLSDSGAGAALPMALEGFPAKDGEGNPIHYRKVLVAPFGNWVHRGNGEPVILTPARADEWIRNVAALSAAGHKPYVTSKHIFDGLGNFNEPDARDTLGYVERMERDEKGLYSIIGLHGDESLKIAAKNSRSIGISKQNIRDAAGHTYPGETLHHLALVANPSLSGLGGMVRIAASADTPARDVPVFELSASNQLAPKATQGDRMKTEYAQQVRAKLGLGADVPDEQLADKVAERALALSADRDTLNAQVATLTTERDTARNESQQRATDLATAKQEVLSLSADKKEPDALSLTLITKSFRTERAQVIESGVISEAGMQELDKLLIPNGKPSNIALSLSAGSYEPLYSRVCEIVRKFPGIRTDGKKPKDAIPAKQLALSGDAEEKPTLQRVNELRANQHLAPLASLPA